VLVPLLVGLFRRADELACAMADRCYTGEQTLMARPLTRRDRAVLLGGLAWVVVTVLA
jgi:energy-coupling factor transporter transmembrane protein EcfT